MDNRTGTQQFQTSISSLDSCFLDLGDGRTLAQEERGGIFFAGMDD